MINEELKKIELKINMINLNPRLSSKDVDSYCKLIGSVLSSDDLDNLKVLSFLKRMVGGKLFLKMVRTRQEKLFISLRSKFKNDYTFNLFLFCVSSVYFRNEVLSFHSLFNCQDKRDCGTIVEMMTDFYQLNQKFLRGK